MNKVYCSPDTDGFYGVYNPSAQRTDRAVIVMLGDSSDDRMEVSGLKWLHQLGVNALAMPPDKKDYGHHNDPLECFGKAITYLKMQGKPLPYLPSAYRHPEYSEGARINSILREKKQVEVSEVLSVASTC